MRYAIRPGLHLGFAILSAALAARAVYAEDTSADARSQAGLATLEEIVVTSQRREEKLQDVPISISAFTYENLDVHGVRNIDDIACLARGGAGARGGRRGGRAAGGAGRGI